MFSFLTETTWCLSVIAEPAGIWIQTVIIMWLTSVHQPCTGRRPTGRGWIWQAEEYSLQPEREARELKEVHLTPLTSAEAQASDGKLTPLTKRVKSLSEGQRGETHPKILISEGYFRKKCFVPLSLYTITITGSHIFRDIFWINPKDVFLSFSISIYRQICFSMFWMSFHTETCCFWHRFWIVKMLCREDKSSVSNVCEKKKRSENDDA